MKILADIGKLPRSKFGGPPDRFSWRLLTVYPRPAQETRNLFARPLAGGTAGVAGVRGRTSSSLKSRAGLSRLVKLGYVLAQSASMDTAIYTITKLGCEALARPLG
jgi:hypothetical protein